MKYQMLHVFRTSTAIKEKSSDHFKDIYELKLLTNFDGQYDVTSRRSFKLCAKPFGWFQLVWGVINYAFNT